MTDRSVTLRYPDGELELPVAPATVGAAGIGIPKLLSTTGMTTLDQGYVNTASCESAITYIDGDAGVLRYRGYPIEALAGQSSYLEVCYLLIHGSLPTGDELATFTSRVGRHTLLQEDFRDFFKAFPRDAHPMAVLSAAVNALSTFYQDSLDPLDPAQVDLATVRLLAKVPTLAAYAHRRTTSQPFLYPDNSRGLVENFLRMSFGFPAEDYVPEPALVRALDMLFVLHADHEQNCSTSTVRMVGSAHANLFTSISSGVNALSGPLHGGANEAVLQMLADIRDEGGDVSAFVSRVKNREDGVRLMGFGHRVYKNYDPRAALVKDSMAEVLAALGKSDPLLDIALELEQVALADDYFVSRKLYPNVDFYTGLIYRAMAFPNQMFTVLFAIGRLPGWIAHWREMMADPATRIGRPRQVYIGEDERPYVPVVERG